jgi:hypothetical protein
MRITILALLLLAGGCTPAPKDRTVTDPTYCNPLDLDYGWGTFRQTISRTSADPVIVFFKDKYYLFSTHDTGGYRVSDDLVTWKNLRFNAEVEEAALNYGSYVAPGVAADDNYVYFMKLNRDRSQKTVKIIRSADPSAGVWEVATEIRRVSDPTIFIDNGRYFIFHGLGPDQSIKMFELDPVTLQEIPGSERLMLDYITDVNDVGSGYHFGRRELWDETDASAWKGRFERLPCTEGSWVVNRDGRYYLQFATPGTLSIWYCDVVMESDRPDGGFTEMPYNPVSLKAGGFIGSAGHGSVFRDRYGNWWEVSTMWVGNRDEFERRLALFPVSFDARGRMKVHTLFGDYPSLVPQRRFDPETEGNMAGWWNVSFGSRCSASSSLEGFSPSLASDENVRTWWSAASGQAGEWLQMDLGGKKRIAALQLNFAEQQVDTTLIATDDYTAYKLYASMDGERWEMIADRSANTRVNPHEYIVLQEPTDAAYVKVENVRAMDGGKFAVRDVRLFGHAYGDAPRAVERLTAERDRADERYADLQWTPVADADGYMVRFGYAPDYLNLAVQLRGGDNSKLQLHILTKGQPYWYRVDSYNGNGVTQGVMVGDK